MSDITPDELREALQCLITSDLPADPKRILISAVMDSLVQREAAIAARAAVGESCTAWKSTELDQAVAFLKGKVAKSWQNADEIVMHLARELHRLPVDVRNKAIELGFAVAVDYRQARTVAGEHG